MEGIASRKIMAMMIIVLLAARVQAVDELDAAIHPSSTNVGRLEHCIRECGPKCVIYTFPTVMALCLGLCVVECKNNPNEAVLNCTRDCANSMVKSYNPTDDEKVASFVDSCYESCKHK